MITVFISLAALAALSFASIAGIEDYYVVESIPTPKGVDGQIGGLDVTPAGKIAACFHQGEVYLYDPETEEWKKFARGLHEPLGILANGEGEFYVMQRPELTRLVDEDGDGVADVYETVTDAFGMTGNYHEYGYGPIRDGEGNLVISLNVASNVASIFQEVRGDFIDVGLPREDFYGDWKAVRERAGRMFARVPYRGWVAKVNPETGEFTPWASGFRSPNGICFDAEGRLFVTDNQGDWLGTSKLHHVEKDGFYGHPASLVWRPGWTGDPLDLSVAELDAMREKAAVLFPQGIMANSPTQPVIDGTNGQFGPYVGQMIVGEMNQPRLIRVLLEEVDGQMQGACLPFMDGNGLRQGNNRLVFDRDGQLWVGQTQLAWAGGIGLQRIRWTGIQPPDLLEMTLTERGFDLSFTKPIAPETWDDLSVRSYRYAYHAAYGSDQLDLSAVKLIAITPSSDHMTLSLELPLTQGFLYELNLETLRTAQGEALLNPLVCYQVNRLRNPVKAGDSES